MKKEEEEETDPKVWHKRQSHSKTISEQQKTLHMSICLEIPFHPCQPTFDYNRFVFFSFFFLLPASCLKGLEILLF